jgi:hypothetical protein
MFFGVSGYFANYLICFYNKQWVSVWYRKVSNSVKGKTIPLQALTGPEGSRRLRLPDFKTIGTWRWQGCQPCSQAAFIPRKYSWYLFLLEAELLPGHSAAGRITLMKHFNDTIGNRSRYLPVCSAVPQPLRHRMLPLNSVPYEFTLLTACS